MKIIINMSHMMCHIKFFFFINIFNTVLGIIKHP